MKKGSRTSAHFYSGWRFPEGLRPDMKKEIHHIEKRIFSQCSLIFPHQISDYETQALYQGYKKILYETYEDKKRIFSEFFSHTFETNK